MGKPEIAANAGGHRHFSERPSQVFIDHVSEHIAKTGQPETFPDLFRGRLETTEDFVQLKKISIDVALRPEGDRAPCPRCHSPNKFMEGWLVYFPDRGAVAVVGNECATGEAQAAAKREWEIREQRRKDEDYLMEVVPRLPTWLTQLNELLSVARPAQEFAAQLRSEGKEYFTRLKGARAQGGRLTVTQVLEGGREGPRGLRTTGSTVDTVEHDVGTLSGCALLKPAFAPVEALIDIERICRTYAQADADAAFFLVTDMDADARHKAARALKAAARSAAAIAAQLTDCRAFLSAENVALLDQWGQHPYSDPRFTVALQAPEQSGHRRFEIRGKPYFQHRVPPDFWQSLPQEIFASS